MGTKNIILADCDKEEVEDLAKGLEKVINEKFFIISKKCNMLHKGIENAFRYIRYALFPIKIFIKRNQYNYIIGWQQFFTLFLAFYCKVLHVKKVNKIVVCNFTYKDKKGILGKIYKKFMKYTLNNKYLDYIHVLSNDYADKCSMKFNVERNKFIVTHFGMIDLYERLKNLKCEYKNFCLSIGRSNRDYDFLINTWKKMNEKYKLIIISDTYKTMETLPKNIIIINNLHGGDEQFKYILNCDIVIIPIKDGSICSGDSVLLNAMSFKKVVLVTKPSTLAEMYIVDKQNGVTVNKNEQDFIALISKLLENKAEISRIGENARRSYEEEYSRFNMGKKIGEMISNENIK